MAVLKKKLCKYAKEGLKKNEELIMAEVRSPQYICKKCLRVSTNEKLLCDSKEITRNE